MNFFQTVRETLNEAKDDYVDGYNSPEGHAERAKRDAIGAKADQHSKDAHEFSSMDDHAQAELFHKAASTAHHAAAKASYTRSKLQYHEHMSKHHAAMASHHITHGIAAARRSP
jgi:hypothetical protein